MIKALSRARAASYVLAESYLVSIPKGQSYTYSKSVRVSFLKLCRIPFMFPIGVMHHWMKQALLLPDVDLQDNQAKTYDFITYNFPNAGRNPPLLFFDSLVPRLRLEILPRFSSMIIVGPI